MEKREVNPDLMLTMVTTKSVAGGYVGFIKELPGVASQGESKEELKKNLYDAMICIFKANKAEAETKKILQNGDSIEEEVFDFA